MVSSLLFFLVALAFMLGASGATLATVTLGYDLVLAVDRIAHRDRATAYAQVAAGYGLALLCAIFVAIVAPGLTQGCP